MKISVYKASTVSVEYDSESKVLFQKWTGFSVSETFREAIDASVSFVIKNDVKAILNDTLAQNVVKPEDTEYASAKMPVLFKNGVKVMAVIVSENIITKMSLKKFEEDSKEGNIKMFSSSSEAIKWIRSLS